MITSLTDEQKAKMPDYVSRWTAIATSTQPANRQAAEEGVREAYRLAGFAEPRQIVWCQSPIAAITIINMVMMRKKDPTGFLDKEKVKRTLNIQNYDCGYGQNEASWLGFYEFFRNECGLVTETDPIQGLDKIARNAGWFYAFDEMCFICERHSVCELNDANQLHCITGPALAYPDNFKLYAIGGHIVPERVVMDPGSLTITDIEGESNAEVRRIMIERMGFEKYLEMIQAVVVHEDMIAVNPQDPVDKHMPRALLRDKYNLQYLVGTDGSTHRVYYMSVSPDVKTCKAAHESICMLSEDDIIASS